MNKTEKSRDALDNRHLPPGTKARRGGQMNWSPAPFDTWKELVICATLAFLGAALLAVATFCFLLLLTGGGRL